MTSPRRPSGTSSGRPQSAVLIPVPAAEPLVDRWRQVYDPVAPAGVPAHITLVVPWVAPAAITAADIAGLAEEAAGEAPFDFDLSEVRWFDERVLWLAPEPADTFRALTDRLAKRFGTPPWDGEFDEVIPHLTVAHVGQRPASELAGVASALAAGLPLRCRAEELWVMVGDGGAWTLHSRVPLGAGSGRPVSPRGPR